MANKANLRKWVAALRSGAFKQGVGSMKLETPTGPVYCCLGVAQEIALRSGHLPKTEVPWGPTSALEPSILQEFYGLSDGSEFMVDAGNVLDKTNTHLALLNDVAGWDFNQIADAVEKKFDLLTYDEIYDPTFVPANETVAT